MLVLFASNDQVRLLFFVPEEYIQYTVHCTEENIYAVSWPYTLVVYAFSEKPSTTTCLITMICMSFMGDQMNGRGYDASRTSHEAQQ